MWETQRAQFQENCDMVNPTRNNQDVLLSKLAVYLYEHRDKCFRSTHITETKPNAIKQGHELQLSTPIKSHMIQKGTESRVGEGDVEEEE